MQLIGVAVTVATLFGGIIIAYFHLAVGTKINSAKDEILTTIENKYVMTVLADQKEREIRRRLRALENKVFKHTISESDDI